MSDSPRQGPETRSPDRPRDSHVSPDRRGRSRSSHSRDRGHHSRRAERERDEQKGNVVYVAKLSRQTRESDLSHGFKAFGPIKTIVLKSSFAFITFEKAEHATEAIARMNGTKFVNGEELLVELSGKPFSIHLQCRAARARTTRVRRRTTSASGATRWATGPTTAARADAPAAEATEDTPRKRA